MQQKMFRTIARLTMVAALLMAGAASAQLIPYGSSGWSYDVVPNGSGVGFEAPLFDDSAWDTGEAPWGSWEAGYGDSCAITDSIVTEWLTNTDILVRRTVPLCEGANGLAVAVKIDNDIQVFWNGVDITEPTSPLMHHGCAWDEEAFTFAVPANLLIEGDNVVAVRGIDRGIISFLDIEVRGEVGDCTPEPPPIDCTTATSSAAELWPPNHKYREIGVEGVLDSEGNAAAITINSIFQDESVLAKGSGAGKTCPDGSGVGTSTAQVRAERNGNPNTPGNGRVYTINFTATGGGGETCTGSVRTCVPHDQGQGPGCVDDGALYSSTPVCP